MKRQKPWMRQEAALLLDGYLRVLDGSRTRRAVIEEVSSVLRAMAVSQGEEIDDVYRNVNGIAFQLSSMESAYQGYTVTKPATSLFSEIVHLYRTDPDAYSKLLSEAMSMTYEKKIPSKQGFFSWFQEKTEPNLAAQYQFLFFEIEKYCKRTKSIGAGLFDPLSEERILQIQRVMENDKWYRVFRKKQLEEIRKALQYIVQYLRYVDDENARILANSSVIKDAEEAETQIEAKSNDEPPAETEIPPAAASESELAVRKKQKTYFQDDREEFYLWLGKDGELSEKDRKRIVSAIRISEMYLQDNISSNYALFSMNASLVRESIGILLADSAFKARNEEQRGKYYAALQKLRDFNNQRDPDYLPVDEPEDRTASDEQAVAIEMDENTARKIILPVAHEADDGTAAEGDSSTPITDLTEFEENTVAENAPNFPASMSIDPPIIAHAVTLPLSEQIETILREECKKNPYGTTIAFIKGKIPEARGIEIKNILSAATWAKSEMGAWKYVFPTASSQELAVVDAKLSEEGNNNTGIIAELDYKNLYPLVYKRLFSVLENASKGGAGALSLTQLYELIGKINRISVLQEILSHVSWAQEINGRYVFTVSQSETQPPLPFKFDGQSSAPEKKAAPVLPRNISAQDRITAERIVSERETDPLILTKFVRTVEDQTAMKADPEAFRSVYYTLKEQAKSKPEGSTATDIFLALNGRYKRKQIIEVLQAASWAKKVNDYSFLFYDEQREEKMQKQSEEKAQSIEQEFFAWLPTAVPPGRIGELKRNVPAIDAVLQQKRFLPQPLFLTTKLCNVEAAEIQARRKLPSQKQRDMASELLRAYAAFLREKKKTSGEPKENCEVTPEEGWIRFDFSNAESFYGTVPVYCSLDGQVIEEKNWARVLVAIANIAIAKNNPALQSLYKHALIPNRNDRPFFLKKAIPGQNCVQLNNGCWINVNFVIPRLMEQIQALCLHCRYSKRQVVFYGLPRQMRTAKERASERKSLPLEATPLPPEAPLYSEILSEKFVRGFRIGSGLDMKKFKRYYEEKTGGAVEKTDAQIEAIITRCGIRYDEKLFVPAIMLPAELREELFSYIRSSLNTGKTALYYEAIFKEFSERFLDHYIYSAEMLKSYIAYYNNSEFYLDSKYLSKEAAVEVYPFDDVKEYLLAAGVPVESDQICRDLSHIPQKTVMFILGSNAEFVNNGVLVANGSNSYFFIDVVELTDEDIDNIAALIQNGVEEREFLSGNELIEAIRARYPHILESNAQISPLGMRDAIKYRLKDRFSFTGNVISKLNQAITMSDVFGKYAKDHPEFTISELATLAEEMNSGVYFDDVYVYALRIDAKRFVSKEMVRFQVAETDAAIENACSADYFPLRAIQTFSFFPDAGYPWNTVLLESYGYSFSQKYRLLHAGFNRTSSVGALVKRSSGIDSFDALLVRALADSTEKLDKEAALAFFVKQGYLARRIYSGIEAVLLEAKAIRNKKGME